ncbi:NAD(P)-binding protein [Eremomyces bilateralis CBS 781.70]|uniref:NAD(P)-binding protein n=1 Tax=Eremomyces bilateralis CBS 781.70 TaxID=1392243 RepID=A0A6G1FZ51_9PEZI|nr:NAD(P)-binding protein [Eremomyces bilateralis CBS 781.70]KAF1811127.1 NAD(P)-binding protein [Eremomyces bilateralis CBS 781.70]
MKSILIVGGTRNLGKALCTHYTREPNTTVYATARYGQPTHHPPNVHWISGVDISHDNAGYKVALGWSGEIPIDIVYIVATGSHSHFVPETLENPNLEAELNMYKTFAIGPLLLVQNLIRQNILAKGAKVIFIGNEAGSIALRNKGGDYGYHGSQAALNMTARLLSFDLKPKGIAVGVIYPGHMKLLGEHKHTIHGDEVAPAVASKAVVEFVENEFNLEKSGQLWAARGFASLPNLEGSLVEGNAADEKPIELPW